MRVRRIYLDKDYPIIKGWWEKRGTEAPQKELLSQVGVISEQDGVPVACAFLYEDKGGVIAFIEWEATNPDIAAVLVKVRALNQVFDFFETYCHDNGIGILFSWVKSGRGDGRILERRKWKKCPGDRHELMAFSTKTVEASCL